MYEVILNDFLEGVFISVRMDYFLPVVMKDEKLKKLCLNICKYNLLFHFLPMMLVQIFDYVFGISLIVLFDIIYYPINISSCLFHLLHYMDLVNIISAYSKKNTSTTAPINTISLAVTMAIYNLAIYFTSSLVNHTLNFKMPWLALIINFFILTIYHSLYCFNNLWQYRKVDMKHRIDMHEKLWPYYCGYGMIASLIYLYIDDPYILGFYNLYMVIIISLPFLSNTRYPSSKDEKYPSINLKIFGYLSKLIFTLTKNILKSRS